VPKACRHRRTRLIAEDDQTRYLECLDCGELYEDAELEETPSEPAPPFEEDLSDA
jgi:hypothetical protein